MEYVSQVFADSVKMWAVEQMARNGHKYVSDTEAFNTLFNNYNFKYKSINSNPRFDTEINSWRNIPWLHHVLNFIFTHHMSANDTLDAEIKVITRRPDGIVLGYIEKLTVALDVCSVNNNSSMSSSGSDYEDDDSTDKVIRELDDYNEHEFCIEDFEATYDIDNDDMPRLVVFTEKSLIDNNYLFFATNSDDDIIDSRHTNESFSNDTITYEINFYKKNDDDNTPTYHYWSEQ